MTDSRYSMDGFYPRRPGTPLSRGRTDETLPPNYRLKTPETRQQSIETEALRHSTDQGLTREDVSLSLNLIEDDKKISRRKPQRKSRSLKLFIRFLLLIIVIGVILSGVWLAYKGLVASGKIFRGSAFGFMQSTPLKQDSDGMTSVLILGTSEDDEGHGGAYLTDSMMVLTGDQTGKTGAMFSIPRDLYVKFDRVCNTGSEGKINEYFNCVNSDYESEEAESERLEQTRKFIGDIFGLDIQYAVHINNTVLKDAVDAVGGVDVDIQGSGGAPGVLDTNFDWRCNYKCNYVKYDNGVHHLDGEHALFLAMARGSVAPTYGLGNSNFDREVNQQKIILALKEKATSAGTFTNIGSVTGLIKAMGDNLRTNFETSEIRTLMKLGNEIDLGNVKAISFDDEKDPMMKSTDFGGSSVVIPTAGVFNYSEIRAYIKRQARSDPYIKENARIAVYNGSGREGAARAEADKLEAIGFGVSTVGNATSKVEHTDIYQINKNMPATADKLKLMYGAPLKEGQPDYVGDEVDFVVVLGENSGS